MNVRIQRYTCGIALSDSDDLEALFEKPSDDCDPDEREAIVKDQLAKAEEWARKLNAFDALHDCCVKASKVIGDAARVKLTGVGGGSNAELLKALAAALALAAPKT